MTKRKIKYLLLIIVLAIGIYKLPVNVDKSYDGVIVYNKDHKIEEHVTVKLNGKLTRNIFSVNDFDGTISIGNDNADTNTVDAGNFRTLLKMKSGGYYNFVYRPIIDNPRIHGYFYTSKDFKYIYGYMVGGDKKYEINSNYKFVAPATNIEEARDLEKKILELVFR